MTSAFCLREVITIVPLPVGLLWKALSVVVSKNNAQFPPVEPSIKSVFVTLFLKEYIEPFSFTKDIDKRPFSKVTESCVSVILTVPSITSSSLLGTHPNRIPTHNVNKHTIHITFFIHSPLNFDRRTNTSDGRCALLLYRAYNCAFGEIFLQKGINYHYREGDYHHKSHLQRLCGSSNCRASRRAGVG